MHLTDADEITANGEALGFILGVTARTVNNLEDRNAVNKLERGKYDVPSSVQMYIAWLETDKKVNQHSGTPDYEAERTRLTRAKADKAEVEAALIKNEAHDAGAVESFWAGMISNIRQKLLALPVTLAANLEGEDINGRKEIIETTIYGILNELADYSPEAILGEYLEAKEPEEEDDDAP